MKKHRKIPHTRIINKSVAYMKYGTQEELANYLGTVSCNISHWRRKKQIPRKYWDKFIALHDGDLAWENFGK